MALTAYLVFKVTDNGVSEGLWTVLGPREAAGPLEAMRLAAQDLDEFDSGEVELAAVPVRNWSTAIATVRVERKVVFE
jgi:hypothetical protein